MDSSPIVEWPRALNILGFILGTILEMRGSTRVFSTIFFILEKKGPSFE
jgi:hypothetical protein